MLKWLFENLIGSPWCWHKWSTVDRIRVFENERSSRPSNTLFILQCGRCGDIRQRKVGI